MQNPDTERQRNAILGALVADAASLGFHWLYDPARIKQLSPETPEFRQPSVDDFSGVPGYFAHAKKRSGDLSQYGEQVLVMLQSLEANKGVYDKAHYENQFCQHFGYGGDYVGYIDRPTRDTLNNVALASLEALELSKSLPFSGDDNTRQAMVTKVLACIKQNHGATLNEQIEAAVRQTHDDDALVSYAQQIATQMQAVTGFHGGNDDQLPAIAKLPPLVALYTNKDELLSVVESAVRVTNNNDLAAQFGQTSALILQASLRGEDAEAAIAIGAKGATDVVQKLIDEALTLKQQDNVAVTQQFGMACSLIYGVPSLTHNLVTAGSYQEAVRRNIYAGGDSCGRSILLGAIMGATHGLGGRCGIPPAWASQLVNHEQITHLLEQLYN